MMKAKDTIMLVDDDPINNLIICKELTKTNSAIDIVIFESPLEALDYLKKERVLFDLILLDINMPELNGWQFLDEVNKLMHLKTPIIMITSSIAKKDKEKSESYSIVVDFLVKPLRKDKVDRIFSVLDPAD